MNTVSLNQNLRQPGIVKYSQHFTQKVSHAKEADN